MRHFSSFIHSLLESRLTREGQLWIHTIQTLNCQKKEAIWLIVDKCAIAKTKQQGEAEFEDKKSKHVTKKEMKTHETAWQTQDDSKRLLNVSTQCGPSARSYGKTSEHLTFRSLLLEVIYSKDATLDFCFRHKLLPSERLCLTCGKKMNLITDSKVSDGKRWYCRVRKGPHSHEHRLTIRTDTFFSKSIMTLEEILQFIYLWVHGNSQDTIAHELGTRSNTDVDWASFCREMCEETLMRRSKKIGGKDVVVKIDESKFSKRKYNVGHRVTGGWVFGERVKNDKTKIFLEPVEDRTADTLLAIIQKWILPGSIIWSDCWKAYGKIPNLPEGYKHGTVNHSTNFVNPESGVCTNRIKSDWRHRVRILARILAKLEDTI